jgi:hypothetical protein
VGAQLSCSDLRPSTPSKWEAIVNGAGTPRPAPQRRKGGERTIALS